MNKLIPILYQPEMSLAIIENRKWVTRRLLKHPSAKVASNYAFSPLTDTWHPMDDEGQVYFEIPIEAKYGLAGDILWVRENFIVQQVNRIHQQGEWWCHVCIDFPASNGKPSIELRHWFWVREKGKPEILKRKHPEKVFTSPNIFLPFECCRTFLKVTAVRIERLQEITEDQARGEGIEWITNKYGSGWKVYGVPDQITQMPIVSYRSLWESINGPDSWNANPFVWVIEFSKTEKPNTL